MYICNVQYGFKTLCLSPPKLMFPSCFWFVSEKLQLLSIWYILESFFYCFGKFVTRWYLSSLFHSECSGILPLDKEFLISNNVQRILFSTFYTYYRIQARTRMYFLLIRKCQTLKSLSKWGRGCLSST